MGLFERYLTVWVFLCIVVGIALGHWLPAPFEYLGGLEIAKVNLPIAVLIWLMIIPMLLKIDFGALAQVGATLARHRRNVVRELGGETVFDGAARLDLRSRYVRALATGRSDRLVHRGPDSACGGAMHRDGVRMEQPLPR